MMETENNDSSKSLQTLSRPLLILILSLIIMVVFDQMTWNRDFGLQFLLTTLLLLISLMIFVILEKKRVPWTSFLLLVPALFGAVMTVVHREGSTTFFNILLTLYSLLLLALTLLNGDWLRYRIKDIFLGILKFIQSALIGLVSQLIKKIKSRTQAKAPRKNTFWIAIRPYLIGLLLALPLILILAALLASADFVFRDALLNIFNWFQIENLIEVTWRAFYIIILAYLLAGSFVHALTHSAKPMEPENEKPFLKPFLGNIEAFIVLGLVNLLFLSFLIIQFRYFFAGNENISYEGFTYAEYARRGFFELVAVAILSLGLFYLLSLFTKRQKAITKRIFSILGVLLILQVGCMLVSAYQRLTLYETAYGFTTLRTITHVFMIWLGVLLLASVVMELLNQLKRMALVIFLVFFGFTVTLNLLNVDSFIARRNIEHAIAGHPLDGNYLVWNMSSDGIPDLIAYRNDQETPEELQESLNASLACYYAAHQDQLVGERYWSEWHLSEIRAEKHLEQEKEVLESYPFKTRSEKIYYVENGKDMQATVKSYFIVVDDVDVWCKTDDIGN